jgi:hypothetical protein
MVLDRSIPTIRFCLSDLARLQQTAMFLPPPVLTLPPRIVYPQHSTGHLFDSPSGDEVEYELEDDVVDEILNLGWERYATPSPTIVDGEPLRGEADYSDTDYESEATEAMG